MNTIELIIFDVDGLLLDTEAIWLDAWMQVGNQMGILNADEIFTHVIGISGIDLVNTVYSYIEDKEKADTLIREARKKGLELLKSDLRLKIGAKEILDNLKNRDVKMAVATTTKKEDTVERLSRMGIIDYFDYMVCGDEVVNRKPNPEIYNKVLAHSGVEKDKALVLEDSNYGISAAYNAGIKCVQVLDLSPKNEKISSSTEYVANDLFEAWTFIKENYEFRSKK